MNDLAALVRGVIGAAFDGTMPDPHMPAFGAYVLFARNGTSVDGVRALTDALRARHDGEPTPLIAVDQEGGRVARLRDGVEALPPMMAFGACGDDELAARAGEQLAFDLRRAGCNLDLAPVLDLALEPANTVIGNRAFGADAAAVTRLGRALGSGLERGGGLACYKHFPGHGGTAVDSHRALPVLDDDAATLRERDLVPFAAVAAGAPAIMGAHVLARAIDERCPVSLSARAIALLRDELGFTGAYVTDALEMDALCLRREPESVAVDALAAGADLLLFGRPGVAPRAALAVQTAVERGTLAFARLEQAHARIARLRARVSEPLPLDAFAPHPGVGREAARRAITLLRGLARADPVASCAVYFLDERADGAEERDAFAPSEPRLAKEAPALHELRVPVDPSEAEVNGILERLERGGRRPLVLSRRAHLHDAQARAILRIVERYADAAVISSLEPFDLPLFARARHLLACYGDDPAALAGLADVLFGGCRPEGRLPVGVTLAG